MSSRYVEAILRIGNGNQSDRATLDEHSKGAMGLRRIPNRSQALSRLPPSSTLGCYIANEGVEKVPAKLVTITRNGV